MIEGEYSEQRQPVIERRVKAIRRIVEELARGEPLALGFDLREYLGPSLHSRGGGVFFRLVRRVA